MSDGIFQIGPVVIGMGTIIAAVCSWSRNKSIAWMLVHAFLFGWIYVIFWAVTGGAEPEK
jgi:hypothetical protein